MADIVFIKCEIQLELDIQGFLGSLITNLKSKLQNTKLRIQYGGR